MANKRKSPEYTERMKTAKEKIGTFYGVILRKKYPEITRNRLLNGACHFVNDWDLLEKIEDVAGIKSSKK